MNVYVHAYRLCVTNSKMNLKSLYVVILSCGLVHFTIIGLDTVIYHTVGSDGEVIYQVSQATHCLDG